MKSYPGRKQQKEGISKLHALGNEAPDPMSEELKDGLRIFKESYLASAERPSAFWAEQRSRIAAKLQRPVSMRNYRPALLWTSAAMVALLCLTLFVEKSKAPTPDLATGSDQNLLVEVEQALNQDCPEALGAAALIAHEVKQADKSAEHSVADR